MPETKNASNRNPIQSAPEKRGAGFRSSSSLRGESGEARADQPQRRQTDMQLAERRLAERVFARCHVAIASACAYSSVPPEFLAALAANESGGNPQAVRFEPAVYRHLKSVITGAATRYGGLRAEDLSAEVEEILHPKTDEFHARSLGAPFAERHAQQLSQLQDEALRELASSWGFTQIMGYHMVGRKGTARDLLEPDFHFRIATQLLAEFAQAYQLDVTREFAELFRCWNTGRPDGATADPRYVENGLRRMEVYRGVVAGAARCAAGMSGDSKCQIQHSKIETGHSQPAIGNVKLEI